MKQIIIILLTLHCRMFLYSQDIKMEIIYSAFEKSYHIHKIKERLKQDEYMMIDRLNQYHRLNSFDLLPDFGYRLVTQIKKEDIVYPDSSYSLYSIFVQSEVYENKITEGRIECVNTFHWSKFNRYYLMAINDNNHKVKYLSGAFFLDIIADDFQLKQSQVELENYLKIRLFNYQLTSLKFKKETRKHIVYTAYSKEVNQNCVIVIHKNNFDAIEISCIN